MINKKEIHTGNFEWDGTDAWIICSYTNMLFKYEFLNAEYKFVALLPENGIAHYDFHSKCVKYKMKVFCLPNRGNNIYIYDLTINKFREIGLQNLDGNRINLDKLEVEDHILYTISYGMKQIIIIDLETEKIINRYSITECDCTLYKAIKCGDIVYAISDEKSVLWQCDLKQSTIKRINLLNDSAIEECGFTTIACVEGQLWLSGYNNKIYIFNRRKEILERYIELPDDLRIYDFINSNTIYKNKDKNDFYFYDCAVFDNTVWFIPYQTNKILYVKVTDNVIREFYIEGEEETDYSLNRVTKRKYEIVKKDKEGQLVLKSYKNSCNYIIDTTDQTMKRRSNNVLYSNLEKIWKEYGMHNINFLEEIAVDNIMYSYGIVNNVSRNRLNEKTSIGSKIYSYICS